MQSGELRDEQEDEAMIESKDNEKLKLVRKLHVRKHRERQGLFATEGEDLLAAGLAAGAKPRFVLVAGGTGLHGTDPGPAPRIPSTWSHSDLLDSVSALGSGTRAIAVWPKKPGGPLRSLLASTSTGSAIPATSARSSAPPTPCSTRPSPSAPAAPIPFGSEGDPGEHGLDLRPAAG